MYWYLLVPVSMKLYEISFPDKCRCFVQHAHIENILQTYETLLKEIKNHPESDSSNSAPLNQYTVESVALADRNLNVPCEEGIRYPSLVAMLNRQELLWRPTVI